MENIASFDNVYKSYNMDGYVSDVLKDINCTIRKGEITFLVGPSGSGKSTFLNLLGLLDTPNKGKIIINGKDTSKLSESQRADFRAMNIGFIFQTFNLIPVLNIEENIEMSLLLHKNTAKERKEKINQYLKAVGLEGYNKRKIGEISGGQRQRIAIARSLVSNPSLILADEPTANLDQASTASIMELISELNKSYGTTFVICTHNESLIKDNAKIIRIIDGKMDLNKGAGK